MLWPLLLVLSSAPTERAAEWLAAFPAEGLRFDAAVGLSQLVKLRPDDLALRQAFERSRAVAERDADHPQLRFWKSEVRVAKSAVTGWSGSDSKVNVNRAVNEALWCDVHGLRPETVKYITGPMRDSGGYRSTHALWALIIARD